jgi:FdrA protein
MGLAEELTKQKGVNSADSGMGTPANNELLSKNGYEVWPQTSKNDLMIAVDADSIEAADKAIEFGLAIINRQSVCDERRYNSLDDINLDEDPFDLVQISLPGEYAAFEARKAIEKGLDVFIFSDNVPIADELELKKLGREKGCLVMGPDAGVGLIGGVALAAGSIVRHGAVGIVGASGSGAQEVACLIERLGYGVSCIIGTGGRDLRPEIGGITMCMGMERLDNDAETKVICLVSKLADIDVMSYVLSQADNLHKPVVAVFLSGNEALFDGHKAHYANSLEEAALKSVELLSGKKPVFGWNDEQIREMTDREISRLGAGRKYLRGIYCGGTFAEESMMIFSRLNPSIMLNTNLDIKYANKLESHYKSKGHTILDLGSEGFTTVAPHPVFDPGLRLCRLEQELEDPETAVILLDFITGPGVHENPIMPFIPIIKKHPGVIFIAAICGADADPQDIATARAALEKTGVIVSDSNYQSARFACALISALDRRNLQ